VTEASVLAVESVSKSYPGVRALDGVDFEVRRGEIHALLGQNGAGKSTLMNVLAGIVRPDRGSVLVEGAPVVIGDPAHARALGISTVHQELSLFPSRSVAENVFVGRLPRRAGAVDRRRLVADTRAALDALELDLDPLMPIRDLAFSHQQMVEIAKALSQDGKVLILDEPTSALNEQESAILFDRLVKLRAAGLAIIYVSHRLREVFSLSDRITVLRDGRLAGTFRTADTTPDEVIATMVSRRVQEIARRAFSPQGDALLEVRGLTVGSSVRGIDFDIGEGEILGLAGLTGAGQTEVGRALAGLLPFRAGSLSLAGAALRIGNPRQAMRQGLVYFPADRRAEGLFLRLDVQQNIVAASFKDLRAGPFVRDSQARDVAAGFVSSLAVRTPSLRQRVANLSGGNQQKVVLARGLTTKARVFIADEPTRGIDVGAKAEIYELIRRLAASGKGILLISTEMPELLAVCDRILVLAEGRIAGALSGGEATEEKIMMLASSQQALAG
jgi:ribose transport system ATP-binding protein